VCLYVYPPTVVRQRLGKHVPAATNTHARIEEFLDSLFSMRSLSYQRKVRVCIPPTVVRQRLGKHVPAAANTHATIEKFLDASFSVLSLSYEREGRLCVPRIVVRQRLGKHVLAATNAKTTKEGFLDTFSVRSLSDQRKVCVHNPLPLLGNGSVNTFLRQVIRKNRRILGRVVFCAVLVVSKESPFMSSPVSLFGNGSVKTFLWQRIQNKNKRRIVGHIFCSVRVVSKESSNKSFLEVPVLRFSFL
jgi:hypothetical protein